MNEFSILVGIGASLGLWRLIKIAPTDQVPQWLNAGFLTLLGCLIGSRLFYVFVYSAYFSRHLIEIPQVWLGGLSWPGAAAGGLLAMIGISITWHYPLIKLADHLVTMIPTLTIATWLASWLAGCGYGAIVPAGSFWGVPSRDESGIFTPRVPLQCLAALSLLIYFGWLELFAPPLKFPGQKASLAGLGLALNLLIFSFLRVDPSPFWNGFRPDSWAAIMLCLLCLLIFFLTSLPRLKNRSAKQDE